jgi:hypothetical protein
VPSDSDALAADRYAAARQFVDALDDPMSAANYPVVVRRWAVREFEAAGLP